MPLWLAALGTCVRSTIRALVRAYYSPVRITGRERLPKGPLLLVANHQGSLLDPVLVGMTTRRKIRFLAKSTLFDAPVLGGVLRALGMIPAYRAQDDASQVRKNLEVLNRAAEALAAGDSVGIFPEGKSHDLPRIEQIKSGTARIAMKAVELAKEPIFLVPIGLNFERKEAFRTALWIRVGEPLDLAEFIRTHGTGKNGQRALTEEIESRLKKAALHLDDPQLLPLLDQLEHLVPRAGLKSPSPLARLQTRKRVADALNHFFATDRPRAEKAAAAIQGYADELKAAGVAPRSPVMRFRRMHLTLRLLRDFGLYLGGLVPTLAGLLHHAVPYAVSRMLATRFNDGRPTLALARLGFGLPLMIATYVGVWFALRSYFLPWVAWTWTLTMPYCGFLALRRMRRLSRGGEALVPQVKLCFQPQKLRALRRRQGEVRALVADLAEEYAMGHPREAPVELPWTWPRIGGLVLRWSVILIAIALLWTSYAHWRRTQNILAAEGMDLRAVASAALTGMLASDEAVLRQILPEVPAGLDHVKAMAADFTSGKRSWYSQADNDALRQLLRRYVAVRAALVRMIWRYQKSDLIKDDALRDRAFLCACTAANTLATVSLGFVEAFNNSPEAVRKLNEAEPAWDIPPRSFDTLRRGLCTPGNLRALRNAGRKYDSIDFAKAGLIDSYEPFHTSIRDGRKRLAAAGDLLAAELRKQPLRDARDEGKDVLYGVQTFVSSWMGDTKLREPGKPLISHEQVRDLAARLQPGDIILERRNWYVSNAFLPGYWPHAALYIGEPDDLRKLGLEEDPRVQAHWRDYQRQDARGHACVVIESISEGVVFTSLEHSVGEADSVAVLRPRLAQADIREAIARAFSHAGKPYDFEFDFFSSDKLVCTELVYRAYDGFMSFPLKDIMGTRTLPAIEFVRKYSTERGTPAAQFDLIFCLEGDGRAGCARAVDEMRFLETIQLPGSDLFLQ